MSDLKCTTDCREDLIGRLSDKLDRDKFWKYTGGFILVIVAMIPVMLTLNARTEDEQDARIGKFKTVQEEVVINQKLIQRDIRELSSDFEKQAKWMEEKQIMILRRLQELSESKVKSRQERGAIPE